MCSLFLIVFCRLEDFDGEEVDEEALIEQRRQQRLAIVQVCKHCRAKPSVLLVTISVKY